MWKGAYQLAAALSLLVLGAPAGAANDVSLYCNVESGDSLVLGLSDSHFRLSEDGQPRAFRLAPPETPASIVFLIEHSRTSYNYIDDLLRAAEGFVNRMPQGHWYALASFSNQTVVNVDFTRQIGKLRAGLAELYSTRSLPMWDEVNTYDAVYDMLERLDRLPGRRILVVAASGLDTFSSRTFDELIRKVESTNVTIYTAAAGSDLRGRFDAYLSPSFRLSLLQAQSFLNTLASKSGGQSWAPRFSTAFSGIMDAVQQLITHQYRLVYTPRPAPGQSTVKIELTASRLVDDQRQNYRVRVREGWRFPRKEP